MEKIIAREQSDAVIRIIIARLTVEPIVACVHQTVIHKMWPVSTYWIVATNNNEIQNND